MSGLTQVILGGLVEKADDDFKSNLRKSLIIAKDKAKSSLKPALFEALSFPSNWNEYLEYLMKFSKWAPRQSAHEAWKADDGGPDHAEEMQDIMSHFYFLINQNIADSEREPKSLQDIEWFSYWLRSFAASWGSYLDTVQSWSDQVLDSFMENSEIMFHIKDSMIGHPLRPNAPSGWLTFNQFFARQLNPGLRPIDSPNTNAFATSPADCTFRAAYDIGENGSVGNITFKGTHRVTNIKDLLKDSRYADAFNGGKFVHYFLAPYSYHRYHSPISGTIAECRNISGKVFSDVEIGQGGQFHSPDTSEGGYEFTQGRGLYVVDTSNSVFGNVGLVGVVPIGMAQVSSVNMTAVENGTSCKGEEFGYFSFGGSDIIILYQQEFLDQLVEKTDEQGQHLYRHYGQAVARLKVKQ